MYVHAPKDYVCPFCIISSGGEDRYTQRPDVVYHDEFITAFIAPKWWVGMAGNVLVITNEHYENVYDMPDELVAKAYIVAKKIAIGIRSSYDDCEGTSMRQHNEPGGGQDVLHFHIQVFARFTGDNLYQNHENAHIAEPAERHKYAELLRASLG